MMFVPIMFCLCPCFFNSDYTSTNFVCHIFGISCTRTKEFSKYWPSGSESEEDKYS